MKNAGRQKLLCLIAAVITLSLFCGCLAGCEQSAPSEPSNETPDTVNTMDQDEASWDKERYSTDENGWPTAVNILSEDLVAYYDIYKRAYPMSSGFDNLIPLFDEFAIEDLKPDWSLYQDRLSQITYDLKIHYSLESEVNTIVMRLLAIDGVIPSLNPMDDLMSERFLGGSPNTWDNPKIFDEFVKSENVNIEFIGTNKNSEPPSGLAWQVYSGGCVYNFPGKTDNLCSLHIFNLWLVNFTGTERIIWDMKYIEEFGCGRLAPWVTYSLSQTAKATT